MSAPIDPYHLWLGIPPREQPPNHYRLLGLSLFENDADVVDAAASRQSAYLQQMATGKHRRQSQELLNQIAAARRCLLDSERKARYDEQLQAELDRASDDAQHVPLPVIHTEDSSAAERLRAAGRGFDWQRFTTGRARRYLLAAGIVLLLLVLAPWLWPDSDGGGKSTEDEATPDVSDAPPADVPLEGLRLWLDASSAPSLKVDGAANVSRWADRRRPDEPAAPALVQDQLDRRPQFVPTRVNGRPAVVFGGNDPQKPQHHTLVLQAEKPLDLGDRYTVVFVGTGSSGVLLRKGPKFQIRARTWVVQGQGKNATPALEGDFHGRPRIRSFLADGKTVTVEVHDCQRTRKKGKIAARKGPPLQLGVKENEKSPPFRGAVAELLVYDRPLAKEEIDSLRRYLTNQWTPPECP